MVSVDEMREAIKNAPRYRYSQQWHQRVNNMPDKQVIAIYFRMLRSKELNVGVFYR